MSSSTLIERGLFGGATTTMAPTPSPTQQQYGTPNWCVVPRCKVQVKKQADGVCLECCCDDEVSKATFQNLCKMMAGSTCSCCCTLNGITVFQCNFTCGVCTVQETADGCCITCKSGDKNCCEILQACADAIACCLANGCHCVVSMNNMPVCCGCC